MPLLPEDSKRLSMLPVNSDTDYGKYFIPFSNGNKGLKDALQSARDDRYWGIWFGKELAGFFMLRGFDEGYLRPSFGVFISQTFSNRGLSSLALDYAMSWCRLNGISSMILKIHPDHKYAARVYEKAGFRFVEVCQRTGHSVMEKIW